MAEGNSSPDTSTKRQEDEFKLSVIMAKRRDGLPLTKRERETAEKVEKHRKLQKQQTKVDLEQAAELKFIKKMTWAQVADALGVSEGTITSRVTRHPEVFWAAVDKLFDAAEEEVRRDIRSARLKALKGISEGVEGANKRLEKIITDPESQDSVAMTAIKHIHGSLGVSERVERPLSGDFRPQSNWKERASDLLGVALAGVEKAKQLQVPQIEAEVEVVDSKGAGNASQDGAGIEEGGQQEVSGG